MISYIIKETMKMTEIELEECSYLFSNNYGFYRKDSPIRPCQQIKLSVNQYKVRYCKENFYCTMARDNGKLIGQAFYIRKKYEQYGTMTWVLQLVVDVTYRKKGIASSLLRSIWGFSDDFAWGLATSNICTVRTLESATFRKCLPKIIQKNIDAVKLIAKDTGFIGNDCFKVDKNASLVNTEFFVDNHSESAVTEYPDKWELGDYQPGHEWLAFTFREQKIDLNRYQKHFDEMVSFSETKLKDAYSRMKMEDHPWTKGTQNEVETILKYTNLNEKSSILDVGCGIGRHSCLFGERGYKVTGIDFSESNIEYCLQKRKSLNLGLLSYYVHDARIRYVSEEYDMVTCLYDVIGSFPDDNDNNKILNNCIASLRRGGYLALSVMNMELTEELVPDEQKGIVESNPQILLNLKPSTIMQNSGNIFNPEYIAVDTCKRVVYRKEQFQADGKLSAEYVIRDKRYYKDEILKMIEENGCKVISASYVQAGAFDKPLHSCDKKAKEIFVIAEKL